MAAVATTAAPDAAKTAEVAFPELREKALIRDGEECMKSSIELIESFGLPGGILPLEDVVEGGWVEETGFVWIITKKKQEHYFKKADKPCAYKEKVTCYLEKNRIKDIKGVKAKEMLLWVPVNEICIEEAKPEVIHFKSIAGISRSFPTEYFAKGSSERKH